MTMPAFASLSVPSPSTADDHRAARLVIVFFAIAFAAGLSACSSRAVLTTPNGFVSLPEDSLYTPVCYKAVSADDVVLLVRRQRDQAKGNVDFWSEAITRELLERQGYELLASRDVSAGGLSGKLSSFRGAIGNRVFRYELAVFVQDSDVLTVEAGSPEDSYESNAPVIQSAIESLHFE
ncbi:MAG: hypothetical protein RBU37_01535 [Myxococcota bacterium]|jgi:hypothetical protein|nr:hypothetical protein [Myxococcota bacterium]